MKRQCTQIYKYLHQNKNNPLQGFQITIHIRDLEKQEAKSKINRQKEVINIRTKIKELQTIRKLIQRINETKSQLFEKIRSSQTNQKEKEKLQSNKNRGEKEKTDE